MSLFVLELKYRYRLAVREVWNCDWYSLLITLFVFFSFPMFTCVVLLTVGFGSVSYICLLDGWRIGWVVNIWGISLFYSAVETLHLRISQSCAGLRAFIRSVFECLKSMRVVVIGGHGRQWRFWVWVTLLGMSRLYYDIFKEIWLE